MGVTEKVANFIVETEFDKIPDQVMKVAKDAMLDTIGCMIAGSVEPVAHVLREYVREVGGKPSSSVIGAGFKVSPSLAALANGTMGHALDYDDFTVSMYSHPSVPVLSAVMALGEARKISGKKALESYVIGYEVETKIARGIMFGHHEIGWHTTSTCGTFGSAAATAKILGFNLDKTLMTLGVAGSLASGIRQNFGTMVKPYHGGMAAHRGIAAGTLAGKGLTAAKNVLEGDTGFCKLFSKENKEYNLERIAQIGNPYDLISPGVSIKIHPCCYGTPTTIDLMIELANEYDICPEMVDEIEIGVPNEWWHKTLVFTSPKTPEEAKFSMQYVVASAIRDRKVTLAEFTNEKVLDPVVQSLFGKIKMVAQPDLDERWKSKIREEDIQPQRVRIRLKDGREFVRDMDYPKGNVNNPLTRSELLDKYNECVAIGGLSEKAANRSVELVENLGKLDDITEIVKAIQP